MRGLLVLLPAVLLGCLNERQLASYWAIDNCLAAQFFRDCLAGLPEGPERTTANDWDEVVDACNRAARSQAQRPVTAVKPECMGP